MLYCKGLSRYHKILGLKFRTKLKPKHYNIIGLIFGLKDGIGNRIFGLINAINYFTPNKIYIFWDDKNWVSAKFHDLFNFDLNTEIKEFNNITKFNKIKRNCDLVIEKPDVCIKSLEGKSLGLKYNKLNINTFLKYQKTFQYLKPAEQLEEKINKNIPKEKFTALQIRNNSDWEDFGRNTDLNLFIKELNKSVETKNFFLSSMNKETSDKLKNRISEKIKIFELENKNYKSMQDAVCDLYIMAKAYNAIYSFGSTFGELAFWLSKTLQNVTVIGNQKKWINKKHLKRANLKKYIKEFLWQKYQYFCP